ncbi:MAG TPA: S-methyl-5-thioribose-1-phosphate isomerase [Accumulibacter sp.]|nr:S-methyl-5-thioribose-1-phosphate isomerase [Accumulibacter sp.]HMW17830.1 S-methyl-5-thioribose-1-phosphate isomerase [Accumulibacter sp.]HMX23289.1 S-methyl-5-thioribose-1-phosphate isomerase [Accumulibacter sp.]HMY07512.1 S-methyl-5-thioribose-1-phosphate isomerase [Accumulibacter sp.]HNC17937.1 S-methyl-5-thioribose-1-phosphate isomerase [Accumulibacter sp.]
MKVHGAHTRTIWPSADDQAVEIIDQAVLPHAYQVLRLSTIEAVAEAIRRMQVRGAPLIGITAAHGLALAMRQSADDANLAAGVALLAATRPTAVNLQWALQRLEAVLRPLSPNQRAAAAWREAARLADEDVEQCRAIGRHGLDLLRRQVPHFQAPDPSSHQVLRLMTHCNAGWLATVDYGTALAPIYAAVDAGLAVHIWVSETRPRNQGLLTAWELREQGVPHTVIADNAAGWLLARGVCDAVIVGADRIAANGDVANKIGTCLKALAARAAGVPFYVAAPRSTIDFHCATGESIPIEERSGDELRLLHGLGDDGRPASLRQLPAAAAVANPAFDVTPAALVSAIITERGVCEASTAGLRQLYPEVGP